MLWGADNVLLPDLGSGYISVLCLWKLSKLCDDMCASLYVNFPSVKNFKIRKKILRFFDGINYLLLLNKLVDVTHQNLKGVTINEVYNRQS